MNPPTQSPTNLLSRLRRLADRIRLMLPASWRRYQRHQFRIRKKNKTYILSFIRDNGREAVESAVNMHRPYDLLVPYTRFMFLSYVFKPNPQKVAIIGLGGGAMVHFLKHYDAGVQVDVVELLPAIVKAADTHFGIRGEGNVNIVTADAFDYLRKTDANYDVIYMDAFLTPSRATDSTGAPLALRTVRFYKAIQEKLTREGLVVFNLNRHATVALDITNIREAFPQTYVFELPNAPGSVVVVGTMSQTRMLPETIHAAAGELDRRLNASFSFQEIARMLVQ
jgi:spermidine synthase